MRLRNIAQFLADNIMLVGHDGDLRQVGYDNHLMRSGEICQHARECTRRGAADTGIDLVKHQRIDTVRITQDHLARQHNAAELAARRNAAQGSRRQAGTAAIQKLVARRTRRRPLGARKITRLPNELGGAHLQARHLAADLVAEARGRRIASTLKCLGSSEQLALGAPECLTRLFDLFIAIIDQGQQLLRAIAHGKNIVHGGTPLTQQALEVGIPLAHASELARIKGNPITIRTQLVGAILKRNAGIRKGIGNVAQLAIDGSHTGKLCNGAVHGIERSPFGGKRCMGIVSRGNQYLGMFGARQQFLEFLILARLGVDLGDALEGETRFLDATPLRA